MMIRSIAVLSLVLSVTANQAKGTQFCWGNKNTVFVFGDSYSYVSGELGTDWFTWSNWSNTEQIFDNPIVPGKTTSAGPVWDQYLTGCYQGLPQDCDRQLWNFAYGGATTDNHLVHGYLQAMPFVDQVDTWKSKLSQSLEWDPTRTLAAIFIGLNDVGNTVSWTNFTESVYDRVMERYFSKVRELYDGKVRSFLFFNIPSWAQAPIGLANPELPYNKLSSLYNAKLSQHMKEFKLEHSDANVFTVDTHSLFPYWLEHAKDYGIQNTTGFCPNASAPDINTTYAAYGCMPMNTYFWRDSAHPTYVVHKLMADVVDKELTEGSKC